jgi:hypothetical protein
MKKKVKNHSDLYRDGTGAIINTNKSGYDRYMATRNKLNTDKERIENLETKVDSLSSDISDIKNLLIQLSQSDK